jgi:hypothetical protein
VAAVAPPLGIGAVAASGSLQGWALILPAPAGDRVGAMLRTALGLRA